MRRVTSLLSVAGVLGLGSLGAVADDKESPKAKEAGVSVLEGKVKDIDGKDVDLKSFLGKAVLVINVASQ